MQQDRQVVAIPGQAFPAEGFVLRDGADLRRARTHLLSHWRVPRFKVSIERLPAVESERAQYRFQRLSERCNCLLGEMLGGITLLAGCYWAWVHTWTGRPNLVPAVLAALAVGLAGKLVEAGITRLRLLLVLRRLRRLLEGRIAPALGEAAGDPWPGRHHEPLLYRLANRWPRKVEDASAPAPAPATAASRSRPYLRLAGTADVGRAAWHVLTRWKLPRIEVDGSALPRAIVDSTQAQLARLRIGRGMMLAAVLATVTCLGGFLVYLMSRSNPNSLTWAPGQDRASIMAILGGTLLAALLGFIAEATWSRLRLLWLLTGLKRQFRRHAAGAPGQWPPRAPTP